MGENYLMFNYWSHIGAWNTATNNEIQGSLCQYNPRPCEAGWKYSEHNGLCYQLVRVKTNWTESIMTCKSATQNPSANLASISDYETNHFLAKLTKRVSSWIGAYKTSDGIWKWSDGSEWGYTNWGIGEPNNPENSQDYALFNGPGLTSGKWKNHKSEDDFIIPALCQYKIIVDTISTTPSPTTLTATIKTTTSNKETATTSLTMAATSTSKTTATTNTTKTTTTITTTTTTKTTTTTTTTAKTTTTVTDQSTTTTRSVTSTSISSTECFSSGFSDGEI